MARNPARTELDEVNRAIIAQLQEDGRRPYASIGKAVGLSEAAVRQRVGKMVESGVMQIVAVTDPTQVGFDRQAMIAITASGDLEALAAKLAEIPEVVYIVVIAGGFDILAEVVVAGDDHLLRLVNGQIRAIPGVTRTETFLYLKLAKQTYDWGAR
ncbi:AsnC family transcriptional regulator [Jatrophihabitans sp. GAS493]|uniref:Lrp/AsnC family transcriptional regulator n=1 Tax=Jatrophihabitans sp. GAS493 TaxID=1907575 RepID=UPI000BB94848|nr:Lrp/AsnC family transcriptional regulator [Jatrophihabitans sp. GAS493]SOD74182.1 AsnC family transcriptional regulator [Jatrophihabitans sp. GAS493]